MRGKADFIIKSEIEELMDKGEANLAERESDHIRNMALAIQSFDCNFWIN